MIRVWTLVLCALLVVTGSPVTAVAQKSVADVLGRPATPEGEARAISRS